MKATNKIGSMFLRCILLRMKELGVSQTELARCAEEAPLRRVAGRRPLQRGPQGVARSEHHLGSAPLLGHRFATRFHLGGYSRFAKALQRDFLPMLCNEKGERYGDFRLLFRMYGRDGLGKINGINELCGDWMLFPLRVR